MRRRGGKPENSPETFWAMTEPEPNTGCLLWLGRNHKNERRYGRANYQGARVLAHRLAYTLARGPIPDGMTLDHRCRLPMCVNPDHLEPVTLRENQRRGGQYIKTHCPRGHAYDGISRRGNGREFRYCKTCDNARTLKRYHDRKARAS